MLNIKQKHQYASDACKSDEEEKTPSRKHKKLLLLLLLLLLFGFGAGGVFFFLNRNRDNAVAESAPTNDNISNNEDYGGLHDGVSSQIICERTESGALNCVGEDELSNAMASVVLDGNIICIKDTDGIISCSDGNGTLIETSCSVDDSGGIVCVDSDGDRLDNILTCVFNTANSLLCDGGDGTAFEVNMNEGATNEVVNEVEKEVIREVEKEVVVVVDKTPPALISRQQNPTTATNGSVVVTLELDKNVQLPSGWNYADSKSRISRTFSENIDSSVTVYDADGNAQTFPINISNIDKTPPVCLYEVAKDVSGKWTYTIYCDKPVSISGWTAISGGLVYRQEFDGPQVGSEIKITDNAGNTIYISLQ